MYKTTLYSSSESVILRKNKCDGPLPPHDSDPLTQSKVTSTRLWGKEQKKKRGRRKNEVSRGGL